MDRLQTTMDVDYANGVRTRPRHSVPVVADDAASERPHGKIEIHACDRRKASAKGLRWSAGMTTNAETLSVAPAAHDVSAIVREVQSAGTPRTQAALLPKRLNHATRRHSSEGTPPLTTSWRFKSSHPHNPACARRLRLGALPSTTPCTNSCVERLTTTRIGRSFQSRLRRLGLQLRRGHVCGGSASLVAVDREGVV